jgi:hypothetical protein
MICLAKAVLSTVRPEVLQLADALIKRIIASQPINWHAVFQSAKEVLLTSFVISYWKVCTRWAPQNLTVNHKTKRQAISSELFANFKAEREALSQIVTADETWIHYFKLETKRQSMEWH